jgi:signal transduction histidine kinase
MQAVFRWCCLLWLMPFLVGCVEPTGPAWEIRQAHITVEAGTQRGLHQTVSLPDGWDDYRPPLSGAAVYRFEVPQAAFDVPQPMLYAPKVGNAYEVFVQGRSVYRSDGVGRHGAQTQRSHPQLVPLPRLLAASPVLVAIRVEGEHLAVAGISNLFFGDRSALERPYLIKHFFHTDASWIVAMACFSMGLLALLVWTRVRDPLYLLFGAASVIWAWRTATPGQSVLWMAPWLSSYFFLASYGWFVALIALYVVGVTRMPWRGWPWLLWTYFALATVMYVLVVQYNWVVLRTVFNTLTFLVVAALFVGLIGRLRQKMSQASVLLGLAGLAALLSGGRDWWAINFSADRYANQTWARYAVLSFMVVMAWLLVDRLVRLQNKMAQLNRDLENRVRIREAELATMFEKQKILAMSQAATHERERIVRDMHDGIGGQLMTVLRGVERGSFSPERIAQIIQDSLDDLRLIIDASSAHSHLMQALAAWRNRWDPRLDALGIELQWQMDEHVGEQTVPAQTVLQMLRLLQEAVINAVKHAHTQCIAVEVALQSGCVALTIRDHGQGFDVNHCLTGAAAGHYGLKSMQARATDIQADLKITSSAGHGTEVSLIWPARVVQR